ncbi:M15 family metallopeptidase [Paenibacillus spongiae]|uniref:M15 family metallopeptidase n=1 Tax=Paenibacillus spongiae TaxID=2909671 RepID=A0ABY5SEG9_9BACL|nr:M15 family metallopeptidase [Paenibacillus spongiae]UVI31120.1 M15 family metallopeptidase [Paenibacillus spongiae]
MKNGKRKSILSYIVISTIGATLLFSAAYHSKSGAAGSPDPTPAPRTAVKTAAAVKSSGSTFLRDNAPSRTGTKNPSGTVVVWNLSSTVVLVNKERTLPSSYVPSDLVVPNVPFSFSGSNPKKQLRKPAAAALEKLFAGAKKDGISLKAVSGYRSYATQQSIFARNAKLKGEALANKTSARAGQSEHQTGLAMDVSSASVDYTLEQRFGKTKEGKWLKANAAKYGFIIRFGEGQEKLTGYSYEPWHIRYVGVWIAGEITRQGKTLEQYLEQFD